MLKKIRLSWLFLGLAFIATLLVFVSTDLIRGTASMTFDKEKWLDSDVYYNEPYVRLEMVDDIIQSRLAKGMTRSEVAELLGPPTETEKFEQYDLVYWLGMEKGFVSIDSAWLVMKFGVNNSLAEFKTLND